MYDIQESFFSLIICKVYFLVSVVMLLLHTVSGSRKLMESPSPPLEFAGTFASLFCFKRDKTDLTTVSEIGIVIVHVVYFKNKIGVL